MKIEFWEKNSGKSPVLDFIKREAMNSMVKKKIRRKLERLEMTLPFRNLILSREVKRLRGHENLYQMPFKSNNQWFRFLFSIYGKTARIWHAFKKKSNGTPKKDLKKALNRKENWELAHSIN